ncbi:MAG TPA: phosphoribosyltransferase family protein [Micromonosporaceae bacterium]|jgi:predicted phosphoribosyltransferase
MPGTLRGEPGFADRAQGGRLLGTRVAEYLDGLGPPADAPLVLALPRGGVPVGLEVARAVGAELDVVVARKIGLPGHSEFGIGAVTDEGPPIFNHAVLRQTGLTEQDLAGAVAAERAEVARRLRRYRGDRPPPRIAGRTVIVVDDGLATGVTAFAALRALRQRRPERLIFAAPVCADDSAAALSASAADAVICLLRPRRFRAVGEWYADFAQLTDDEVEQLLAGAGKSQT